MGPPTRNGKAVPGWIATQKLVFINSQIYHVPVTLSSPFLLLVFLLLVRSRCPVLLYIISTLYSTPFVVAVVPNGAAVTNMPRV